MTPHHDDMKLVSPIPACRCAGKIRASMVLRMAEFVIDSVFARWRHVMGPLRDIT